MHLVELTLHNWGPYLGEHKLQLRDTVYAVQATTDQDAERSNWVGKTWFLGAIRFLLTGVTPETCPNEDGWVTWGEREGRVAGRLSDGTTISRTRTLGKGGTQLEVQVPGHALAKQDKAQTELLQLIGVGDKDLVASSFVEQGQISRLVRSDPADRTSIVNGWLQLAPLQRAEDWLRERLNKLLQEERKLGEVDPELTEAKAQELEAEVHELEVQVHERATEKAALSAHLSEIATWRLHHTRALRFPVVQAAGKRTKAELDKLGAPSTEVEQQLEMNLDTAQQRKGVAADRHYQLRELVQGDWDGVCPKTCEACPVQRDVRKVGAKMERELATLDIQLDREAEAEEEARGELAQHRQQVQERARLEADLKRLRAEGEELLESVDYIEANGAAPDDESARAMAQTAEEDHTAAVRAHAESAAQLRQVKQGLQATQESAGERQRIADELRTVQEALAVVGRQGAQREVAEAALQVIEEGANQMLQRAGIDLEVRVRWAREGKGLATHCDACGAAHPRSQTVKVCQICGVARGPRQVEKLSLAPNDRSGGADDIAGLAFQLSASAWLRRERGVVWSVACIDEPFGALDRANVRSLSTHLHALIRGSYAFTQGFIVAHDASVMEALPARIQICGTEQGSTVEVVE